MDRRCTTIAWIGIVVCLLAVAIEAALIERKGVFNSQNDLIMDRMLRTMDESVSPCQDFYKYSRGRGLDPDYLLFNAIGEQINSKFRYLFEKLKDRSHKRGSMKEKVFRLYNSCEAARKENRTSNIFLDVMRPDVNLSWPSYMPEGSKWPKERFRWLVTLGRLARYGLRNALFQISLKLDSEDSPSYVYNIERISLKVRSDLVSYNQDKLKAWGVSETAQSFDWEVQKLSDVIKRMTKRLSLQELETGYGISLIEYFKILIDQNFDPNTQVEVDVDYMVALHRLVSSYDQEAVASYLMKRFGSFMTSYQDSTENQCAMAVRTSMKAATELLYEKHILNHTKEYESEIQRVFEAIRNQFSQRLEANRLNLSASYISNIRKRLSTTTVNVGVLPKKKNRRGLDNYLYDKLDFGTDDDFATMQLKAMEVLTKAKDLFLDKWDISMFEQDLVFTIEFGVSRTIFIPYDLLVEPFFISKSHDVFKVSMQGFFIAKYLLKALYPKYLSFDCEHYKEFISLFDDKQLYWDRSKCYSRSQLDDYNKWGLHLVLLNMVHDAYFSSGSGFSQVQPDFTSKPLKELFFLNFAQNTFASKSFWNEFFTAPIYSDSFDSKIYNPVFNMTTFAEAFNCSTNSYAAANYIKNSNG